MEVGFELTIDLKEGGRRKVVPVRLYQKGILWVEACDAPQFEPRCFFIREALQAKVLFQTLQIYWAAARRLPPHFTPQKRLPAQLLEAFSSLKGSESLTLFEKLAQEGYFYPVTPLQKGFLPKGISWEEVPSICLR